MKRIACGVPRALKAPAGLEILNNAWQWGPGKNWAEDNVRILENSRKVCIFESAIRLSL